MDIILEAVNLVTNQLLTFYNNFVRNAIHMWDGMTLLKYIRLVAIVGGYFLLRPYLEKLSARVQKKELEKMELDPYDIATRDGEGEGKISPNALRGATGNAPRKENGVVVEENTEEAEAEGADWGKKARTRQRAAAKKLAQGNAQDGDLFDHLVDYEPGKDGW